MRCAHLRAIAHCNPKCVRLEMAAMMRLKGIVLGESSECILSAVTDMCPAHLGLLNLDCEDALLGIGEGLGFTVRALGKP